jgi:hypothetical protein
MVFAARGIAYKPYVPNAHHKNDDAERKIRTTTENARAMMMIDSQALIGFWREAVYTAVYLHQRENRDGYHSPNMKSYQILHTFRKPTHND